MINPKISIIIPVYNSEKDLEKTLKSIRKINYNFFEVLIIDGNSSDNTLSVIEKNKDIIDFWLSEEDKGEYDAMNKGILNATGDGLIFIMAGDYFLFTSLPNYIPIPSFFHVNRLNDNQSLSKIKIKSDKQGLPNCHQGILFENRKEILYNLKYKIAADYKYFLDFNYNDCLPTHDEKYLIVYDEGFSGENFWDRDLEIYEIIKDRFGIFLSIIFFSKAYLKKIIKGVLH